MKGKCLDIGMLQGFVDGELTNPDTEKVIRHLALCEHCPSVVADLESQNELVFSALDSEYDVMVPTERLRAKVFASIDEIESGGAKSFWPKWLVLPTAWILRPGFAMAACLLLFAALFSIGFRILNGVDSEGPLEAAVDVRDATDSGDEESRAVGRIENEVAGSDPDVSGPVGLPASVRQTIQGRPVTVSNAVYRKERNAEPKSRGANESRETGAGPPRSADLDAEEGYLTTIATLSRTVNENKDYVLRPSERVTYERNLAVVNDAIKKMKGEVRTDPNNSAAREVLRSSYQNKIDLLSSVADRAETVASLN